MPKLRVLLVDDEHLALTVLSTLLGQLDDEDVEIVGQFQQPLKALEFMGREPVDLLFLDVQMPRLSGMELLRSLNPRPLTIFTTAYSEYAVEAFGLDAVDYLPKPFGFPRFVQAMNKARAAWRARAGNETHEPPSLPTPPAAAPDFLTVKADGRYARVPFVELLYVEGWQEYARLHTTHGIVTVLERLKNLEAQLPADRFMRVHKSFIIAINRVETLEGNELKIGNRRIPISRSTREAVLARVFGRP